MRQPRLGIDASAAVSLLLSASLVVVAPIGLLVAPLAVVPVAQWVAAEPRRGRLFVVLLLFMLAMIGAVSADNVILLFLFWELTSLTSFLLVGFNHADAQARTAARQALLVTMGGGLALLGRLLLLGQMAGSWTLSGIVPAAPALTDDPRLTFALTLVLLGAFTKSAQGSGKDLEEGGSPGRHA